MSDGRRPEQDNFPLPPLSAGYPGDKTSWLLPGHSPAPHWKDSMDQYNPSGRWTPLDMQQKNGHYQRPSFGHDLGPQSSQAPFDTQSMNHSQYNQYNCI